MSPEKQLENDLTMIFLMQDEQYPDTDNLSGLGFMHKKSFKRFKRSVKNTVKNPRRAIKKRVKRVTKVVKKVAPYAVAGAAMYFAAPYALSGIKYLGAKVAGVKASMMAAKAMAPGEMGPPEPAASMISPEVLEMGGSLAVQALSRRGIAMRSPEARQAVQQYVDQEAYRVERAVNPNAPFDFTKLLLPAAIGVGTVLALKG